MEEGTNFDRLKRKCSSTSLGDAVSRAARGLVDADLSGGVIAQRVARPQKRPVEATAD